MAINNCYINTQSVCTTAIYIYIIIIQQLLKTPKAELCFNYHKEEEKEEEEEEEESLRINLFDFFLKFGGI